MRRIEKLGIELAYAMRTRDSRRQLWEHADAEVRRLERELLEVSLTDDTGSQPVIGEERLYECPGPSVCYMAGQVHVHDSSGAVRWSR